VSSEDSLLNQKLDEYRIEALLGKGGMARVYRAVDDRLDRYVALKIIEKPFRADVDYVSRFEREARAIARLEHDHIVSLYRFGEAAGLLYIAMQFIDGLDLGKIMGLYRTDGEFMLFDDIRRITAEVCRALDYAHSQGVIHRDLKPSNVMLDKQGKVYLTDFGLVLLSDVTTRGEVLGSPRYVSPEQAVSSANVVPQSDLYSVGVILYEMLTGRVPFYGDKPLDVAIMHIEEPVPPPRELRPSLSPELEGVLLKVLEKQPEDRYQSGSEFMAALDNAILQDKGETQIPSTNPSRSSITLADRVNIETASSPEISTDVPDPHQPARQESTIPPAPSPESRISKRLPVLLGFGTLSLILIAVICVSLIVPGLWASGSRGQGTSATSASTSVISRTAETILISEDTRTPAGSIRQTPLASQTVDQSTTSTRTATDTPQATESATATPQPTGTQTQTVTFSDHVELLLLTHKDDSLVVVNNGEVPFSLPPLRLGEGSAAIEGGEWMVDELLDGECVIAIKDTGRPKLPKFDCDEKGERIFRSHGERFWEYSFTVYYDEIEVGRCRSNKDGIECEMEFGD
jgi:serine/threonine-protein kinase